MSQPDQARSFSSSHPLAQPASSANDHAHAHPVEPSRQSRGHPYPSVLEPASVIDMTGRDSHGGSSPPPPLGMEMQRHADRSAGSSAHQTGRPDGYWRGGQPGQATDASMATPSVLVRAASHQTPIAQPAAAAPGSGISLVFKRPPGHGMQAEVGSPGSASGSGKKRRGAPESTGPTRTPRGRGSPSRTQSPYPTAQAGPSGTTSAAATPVPPGALSIFAPPPDPSLPQALQEVIGSSASIQANGAALPATDRDGDTLMREAGEGFESRLRSARGVPDPAVRTGVSASGKGVKVGSTVKEGGKVVKKKGKGKGDVEVPNHDFCSACRGIGKFLCCDGCPRSFHFMCLEPPYRVDELPDEETWYCKKCRAERNRESPVPSKDLKPIPLLFKMLCKKVEEENPSSFKLPTETRQHFQGVGTDARGNYVDADETRTKYDRKGFQEERDGHRLRDGRSKPVACYACGGSSIPLNSLTTDPESSWRQIVSCDYCALHWHLDCLSPPLATMPNSSKKWMCPNHAEQVMARRRTVKNNLQTIDVESTGESNNGNIQVMPDEGSSDKVEYEDIVINRKKYRVPERIIKLDFFQKLGLSRGGHMHRKRRREQSTSDLTSLHSDEDPIERPPDDFEPTKEEESVASILSHLRTLRVPPPPPMFHFPPSATTNGINGGEQPTTASTARSSDPQPSTSAVSSAGRPKAPSSAGRTAPGTPTSDEVIVVTEAATPGSKRGSDAHGSPQIARVGTPKITLRLSRQ